MNVIKFTHIENLKPGDIYAYYDERMHNAVEQKSGVIQIKPGLFLYLFVAFEYCDDDRVIYTCTGEDKIFTGISAFRDEWIWKINDTKED